MVPATWPADPDDARGRPPPRRWPLPAAAATIALLATACRGSGDGEASPGRDRVPAATSSTEALRPSLPGRPGPARGRARCLAGGRRPALRRGAAERGRGPVRVDRAAGGCQRPVPTGVRARWASHRIAGGALVALRGVLRPGGARRVARGLGGGPRRGSASDASWRSRVTPRVAATSRPVSAVGGQTEFSRIAIVLAKSRRRDADRHRRAVASHHDQQARPATPMTLSGPCWSSRRVLRALAIFESGPARVRHSLGPWRFAGIVAMDSERRR